MYLSRNLIKNRAHEVGGLTNPTCEAENGVLRLDFDRRIMLQFRGSAVTSDDGVCSSIASSTMHFGLTRTAVIFSPTARYGPERAHALLIGMLGNSLFRQTCGYERRERRASACAMDPAMRWIIREKSSERSGASASQMGRFETKLVARPEISQRLSDLPAIGSTRFRNARRRAAW